MKFRQEELGDLHKNYKIVLTDIEESCSNCIESCKLYTVYRSM
jgi:hypothetical protein